MPLTTIIPALSDKALIHYHQKLTWKISEDDWDSDNILFLQLQTKIPGAYSFPSFPGGCVTLDRGNGSIGLLTKWPKDVDLDKIRLDVIFSFRVDNGRSVRVECDKTIRDVNGDVAENSLYALKMVNIDYELLCDVDGCYTIEAELKVDQGEEIFNKENSKKSDFVKDIGTIRSDLETSDVVVIAGSERFHCHKNILSARCVVIKNMLAPNTLESELNTIEVKEAPSAAVASMLKYIYSGLVPEDPEELTLDLLNLAEMYLLDCLKEACLKSLTAKLEVVSCISTFIMTDRFMPSGGDLKETVIKFMKCKAEEVVALEDWGKLVVNHPALATELMRAMVKGSKEKHKCQFCVISYDK